MAHEIVLKMLSKQTRNGVRELLSAPSVEEPDKSKQNVIDSWPYSKASMVTPTRKR
jgi:hypothetical protein